MGFLEIAAAIASAGYTTWKIYLIIHSISENKNVAKWDIISRIVNGAVTGVYEDFVRDTKAASGTNQLTSGEKAKARDMAQDRILQGLKDHNMGVNVLSPDEILHLIEESVTQKKTMANYAKVTV